MCEERTRWFHQWFNQDYLKLYSYRSPEEADEHATFLINALDLHGQERILDLGCGTGRHAVALAKRGFETVGIDLSATLIDKGREELGRHREYSAELHVGDMFKMEGLGSFDVVLNMFTSFGYFPEDEQNARVFSVARRHLKDGGKFFLDYLHPHQVRSNLKAFETKEVEGEKVEIFRRIEGNRVIKEIIFTQPERVYKEKVMLYSREQIEEMLAACSLEVVEVWNDYQGNSWRKEGDRQLFYCRARCTQDDLNE